MFVLIPALFTTKGLFQVKSIYLNVILCPKATNFPVNYLNYYFIWISHLAWKMCVSATCNAGFTCFETMIWSAGCWLFHNQTLQQRRLFQAEPPLSSRFSKTLNEAVAKIFENNFCLPSPALDLQQETFTRTLWRKIQGAKTISSQETQDVSSQSIYCCWMQQSENQRSQQFNKYSIIKSASRSRSVSSVMSCKSTLIIRQSVDVTCSQ